MVVTCPNCQKQHRVNESRIPASGVMAKCNGCSHRFKIEPPSREQVRCPNCGHFQPKDIECTSCGVIFSKFKSKIVPRKKASGVIQKEDSKKARKESSPRTWINEHKLVVALVLGLGMALAHWYQVANTPSEPKRSQKRIDYREVEQTRDVGIRRLKGNQPACTTLEAFSKLAEYSHDKNYDAINRMILNGQAWMTREGTRVRIVKSKLLRGAAQVRETDTGRVYWVAYEAVAS